jgi:hypothetical protein
MCRTTPRRRVEPHLRVNWRPLVEKAFGGWHFKRPGRGGAGHDPCAIVLVDAGAQTQLRAVSSRRHA